MTTPQNQVESERRGRLLGKEFSGAAVRAIYETAGRFMETADSAEVRIQIAGEANEAVNAALKALRPPQ